MTPLVAWFQKRMIGLVFLSTLFACVAPPLVYYAETRRELAYRARVDAETVSLAIVDLARQRPELWRYDTARMAERLSADGLGRLPRLVVHDARGADVPIPLRSEAEASASLVWAHVPVLLDDRPIADVWVGARADGLVGATALLALLALGLGGAIGVFLYLVPVRAVSEAERRIGDLHAELAEKRKEEERARIARELHDGAGQALTAARLHLLALRRSDQGLAPRLDGIARHVDEAFEEVRRSTAALLPPALSELGLAGALERHIGSFAEASDLAIDLDAPRDWPAITDDAATCLYRIVQEALHNVVRHSTATHVKVVLAPTEDGVRLEVRDDGQGREGTEGGGLGLESVRERARAVGGEVAFERGAAGATLTVTVPVR